MKLLILVNNENNNYFTNAIKYNNFFYIFQNETLLNRVYRKIVLKTNTPFRKALFNHWQQAAMECDTIILFDTGNAVAILKYLKQYYSDKRIIFWYWNRVSRSIPISEIKKCGVEIWSYDPGDCKEYGLNYNLQFVFPSHYNNSATFNTEYDTFFIGLDKNRGFLLKEMAKKINEAGCSYRYYLVKSKTKADSHVKQEFPYYPPVTYQNLIAMAKKSKALIDITDPEQFGLKLRPLESLYLKKKLITTMTHIKDYDLYNSKNVFVWGVDDISELCNFLHSPYDDTKQKELMKKYSVENWIQNFKK